MKLSIRIDPLLQLKSAEQGSEAGMHHLAQFYKLTEQYKMAVEWYRKYAEFRSRQRREYLGW